MDINQPESHDPMEIGPTQTGATEIGPTPIRQGGRSRKVLAGLAATAALAVGGLTVAAINPIGSAGATGGETTTSIAPSSTGNSGATDAVHRRSKVLDEALDSLVKDGTLTQAQADTVRTRIHDTAKTVRTERKERRKERRQDMVATAAKALGISAEDLRTELKDGQTIAQIAKEKGVDVATVTKALTDEANTFIDKAVADGKIPADKAEAAKTRAAERITRFVDEGPRRGRN